MATWPSDSVRTKDWGSEVLTDADLEAQLDLLHSYIDAMMDETTGHKHDGTANEGPKIVLTSAAGVTGKLPTANIVDDPTFTTFPVTPSADPDADYEVANKQYVDNAVPSSEVLIKAWANLDGTGTAVLRDSFNLTSINDDGTGLYTFTWDTDFASASYAVVATAEKDSGEATDGYVAHIVSGSMAAGSVQIEVRSTSDGAVADAETLCVIAIGDQ